ncbi:MAG: cell division protein ZapA [Candidatus Babeliales bacterium]|nr:cell division protein ZapA [Candidatus Babeliales bacterium]
MMSTVKNYKVTIFGDQYTLASDESGESIVQAAILVDTLMKEIDQHSKIADPKKIAVLVALQIACKTVVLESESEAIKCQEKKLIDRINQELFSV